MAPARAVEATFQQAAMHRIQQRANRRLLRPGSTANGQDEQIFDQLERLRHQRVRRPRIVCQHTVSNRTGQGLKDLQGALKALMEDKRLFPHVGMQVPLNYSMLERLAHLLGQSWHSPQRSPHWPYRAQPIRASHPV